MKKTIFQKAKETIVNTIIPKTIELTKKTFQIIKKVLIVLNKVFWHVTLHIGGRCISKSIYRNKVWRYFPFVYLRRHIESKVFSETCSRTTRFWFVYNGNKSLSQYPTDVQVEYFYSYGSTMNVHRCYSNNQLFNQLSDLAKNQILNS